MSSRLKFTQISKFQGQKGVVYVTWPTFTFWDPLYISGMGKVRDFKFSVRIGRQAGKPKMQK